MQNLYHFMIRAIKVLMVFSFILVYGCQSVHDDELQKAGEISKKGSVNAYSTAITTVDGRQVASTCIQETRSSGEIIQICVPENWNGQLIIYAHGYVSEFEPLKLPEELATYSSLVTSLGFAFATTSFSENGLAIQTGIQEIIALKHTFISRYGNPSITYLTGASQGGIITALALERYPQVFNGGLSLCGPCGDFQRQVNYYGDFRIIFDYFFKGILPGSLLNIPDELIQNWESVYLPKILTAIRNNPSATRKLLAVAQAPYEEGDQATIENTVISVLWYNVFATRDGVAKFGGQPFDNKNKIYTGTGNFIEDLRLNTGVKRYSADPTAKATIKNFYETTGDLSVPMVTEHTTKDPIQLFWHLPLYGLKTIAKGKSQYWTGIPVVRYGHCTFKDYEILGGLALLFVKVTGNENVIARNMLKAGEASNKVILSVKINKQIPDKVAVF